ncbi:MAG TPA: hypothetical protein VNL15_06305 [Dehalococcoidia bacterium]|nr:hypothetical protein [Dehalococcoidia bacterium]
MRSIYHILGFYWLLRALVRGPASFARYLVRRKVRGPINRRINKI